MLEIETQPDIIGREVELNELQAYLNNVAEGRGTTIFISGEAGVGKTRLVDELRKIAQSEGFLVLSGNCLAESLTPYMPFLEALRSGGLDHLFEEESPKVVGVYLLTHTGLMVKEVMREDTKLDPDIFASTLTTVGDFVMNSLSVLRGEEATDALNRIGYGDFTILVESEANSSLVVILTGNVNEFLVDDMKEILARIDREYGKVLRQWNGEDEGLHGIEKLMQPLITSGKYDGIYLGKEDPKARRNLLFENVSLGLSRQAQSSPTLLCIEDLQWADPSTLALMHYVARNAKRSGLIMVGSYRPEDLTRKDGATHPLVETMQLMNREDLCKNVKLGRLPEENIAGVLASLLGEMDLADVFVNRIYRETEGNPLFLVELVKSLVQDEVLVRDNGTWILAKELERISIPSKVYDVILRRLNRLDMEQREVLDYASVIGEIFSSSILAVSIDYERVHLLGVLNTLCKIHKVVHPHDGKYGFDHAKIKEVLYDEISPELRAEYHGIVAESIEELNKENIDEAVGDLAFHYYNSMNSEKAFVYLMKAAERAKKEYSNEEAMRFYTEALELEEDVQRRREILENLGDICILIGDFDRGLEYLRLALEGVEDNMIRANLLVKSGRIHERRGEPKVSIRLNTEALALVEGSGSELEGGVYNSLGNACKWLGRNEEALDYYQKALNIMEGLEDKTLMTGILNNIGLLHFTRGDGDTALQYYREALRMSEECNNLEYIANILNNTGSIHLNRGENTEALSYYRKGLAIRERIGEQAGIASSWANIGLVYENMERYNKAFEYLEKSMELSEKLGDLRELSLTYGDIAYVSFFKGDIEQALDFCDLSCSASTTSGRKDSLSYAKRLYGIICREQGEWEKSLESLQESLRIAKESGLEWEEGHAYCELGLLFKRRGELAKANEYLLRAETTLEKVKAASGLKATRKALAEISHLQESSEMKK